MTGVIFHLQRFSVHDGPGIRTSVFLKGCNLRCVWCHNPEGIEAGIRRHSGVVYGREAAVEEVLDVVARDRRYYERSGGGMTLTGGEPTCQAEFAKALLMGAKKKGIHTAIESNGCALIGSFMELLPHVDLFLMDYKITDPAKAIAYLGEEQYIAVSNIKALSRLGARVRLRCPLIPGVNDDEEHLRAIAELSALGGGMMGFEIMPYHALGQGKAARVGFYEGRTFAQPDGETIEGWKRRIIDFGGRLFQ